jgi:tRNA/rRNA methyltransferase
VSSHTSLESLCVVLVASRNPMNIGAAARAMGNFGAGQLRVVQPYDAAFREARSAVGAGQLLRKAKEFPTVADAVADCTVVVGTTAARNRELQQRLVALPAAAMEIRKRLAAGRVALLFGSEKRGLSNRDFSHCHWLLRIPTRESIPSMNLGQAVAVCLYELAISGRRARATAPDPLATSGKLELLTKLLLDLLESSGYVRAGSETSVEERTRRMLRRAHLPEEDAEVWMGMLRQVKWKIERTGRA